MGQIERYGLYVLVLVIFLILGVAIWGDDAGAGTTPPKTDLAVRQKLQQVADDDEQESRSLSKALRGQFDSKRYADDKRSEPSGPGPMSEADLVIVDEADFEDDFGSPEAKPASDPVETTPVADKPIKALPDLRRYRVSKGDTLTGIAKKFLGKADQWQRIVALNPQIDPDNLAIGDNLLIPHKQTVLEQHLKNIRRTGGKYTVVKGDSLSRISKRVLGSTRFVDDIRSANGLKKNAVLQVGDELVIPAVEKD